MAYLDLHTIRLLCWDDIKTYSTDIMPKIEQMRAGVGFDPVPVIHVEGDLYSLDYLALKPGGISKDGGHKRSIAHFLEDRLLPVSLREGSSNIPEGVRKFLTGIYLTEIGSLKVPTVGEFYAYVQAYHQNPFDVPSTGGRLYR